MAEDQLQFPEANAGSANEMCWPIGFWDWLQENQHIYVEFVRLALEMKRRGRQRWSAAGIIEVMRWNSSMRDNDDEFKINNNCKAGLARLAMCEHKSLEGFFQIRERKKNGD